MTYNVRSRKSNLSNRCKSPMFRRIFTGLVIGAALMGGCQPSKSFAPPSTPMPESNRQVTIRQWEDFCERYPADPSC